MGICRPRKRNPVWCWGVGQTRSFKVMTENLIIEARLMIDLFDIDDQQQI